MLGLKAQPILTKLVVVLLLLQLAFLSSCANNTALIRLTKLTNGNETLLATPNNKPLFYLKAETTKKLKCTASCLMTWIPFTVPKYAKIILPSNNIKICSFDRNGIGRQLCYNNHPLYTSIQSKLKGPNLETIPQGWSPVVLEVTKVTAPGATVKSTVSSGSSTTAMASQSTTATVTTPNSNSFSSSTSTKVTQSSAPSYTSTTSPSTSASQTTTSGLPQTTTSSSTTTSTSTTTTQAPTTTACQPPIGGGDHDYDNQVPGYNDGDGCNI